MTQILKTLRIRLRAFDPGRWRSILLLGLFGLVLMVHAESPEEVERELKKWMTAADERLSSKQAECEGRRRLLLRELDELMIKRRAANAEAARGAVDQMSALEKDLERLRKAYRDLDRAQNGLGTAGSASHRSERRAELRANIATTEKKLSDWSEVELRARKLARSTQPTTPEELRLREEAEHACAGMAEEKRLNAAFKEEMARKLAEHHQEEDRKQIENAQQRRQAYRQKAQALASSQRAAQAEQLRQQIAKEELHLATMSDFRERQLPLLEAEVGAHGAAGRNYANLGMAAGALKISDGAGRIVTVFLPEAQKKLIEAAGLSLEAVVSIASAVESARKQDADGSVADLAGGVSKAQKAAADRSNAQDTREIAVVEKGAKTIRLLDTASDGDAKGVSKESAELLISSLKDKERAAKYSGALSAISGVDKALDGKHLEAAESFVKAGLAVEKDSPLLGGFGSGVQVVKGGQRVHEGSTDIMEMLRERENMAKQEEGTKVTFASMVARMEAHMREKRKELQELKDQLSALEENK